MLWEKPDLGVVAALTGSVSFITLSIAMRVAVYCSRSHSFVRFLTVRNVNEEDVDERPPEAIARDLGQAEAELQRLVSESGPHAHFQLPGQSGPPMSDAEAERVV